MTTSSEYTIVPVRANGMTKISHSAELIPHLLPALISNARMAPEYIIGVNSTLNLDQPLIVRTPELMLPVRFIRIRLIHTHQQI
jgi:hypothetical protein